MSGVSDLETAVTEGAEKQARYAARRRAWAANLPRIVETPGQEFWVIHRNVSDFAEEEDAE